MENEVVCSFKIDLKREIYTPNRAPSCDTLFWITINSLTHLQREIVIIFYVEENIMYEQYEGNLPVDPSHEILY